MTYKLKASALVIIALLTSQAPLHAYIDPGSTSLFLQGIVGGIAALLVVTRNYWQRAVGRFRRGGKAAADRPDAQ